MGTTTGMDKFRISELPSASMPVVNVHPDDLLSVATSKMLINDFSQLPVMTSDRDVKGIISWKTIGTRTQLGGSSELVKHCMSSNYTDVSIRDNLLDVVQKILKEEFVLIRDEAKKISGICTLADIGARFQAQAKPFIEIEQIEDEIRSWLVDKADISYFTDPTRNLLTARKISTISDLTFGDYVRWFEDKVNWDNLGINFDRQVFVEQLRKVNQIRNSLMHFRQDDINKDEMHVLSNVSRFLRTKRRVQKD